MRGKKAPKRTEEEKEVFCRLPDGEAMLTFSFVVSPSRVESQNTRTAALKKLTRRQGESGFGSWKRKKEQGRSWHWGERYSRAERTKHSDHQIYAGSRREKCLLCGQAQCAGQRNLNMPLKRPLKKTKFRCFLGFACWNLITKWLPESR